MVLIVALSSITLAFVEQFDSQANCYDVRIDQSDGPFSKIPVYNQALGVKSDPNICYAVAASELIDAYRIRHGIQAELLTSPLSLALKTRLIDSYAPDSMRAITYDDSDPLIYLVGGGSIFQALNLAQNANVCDQKWLEQFVKLFDESSSAKPFDSFLMSIAPQPISLPLKSEFRLYINNGGSQDFCYTWLTTTKVTKGPRNAPNNSRTYHWLARLQNHFLSRE